MNEDKSSLILSQLAALREELVDLAFVLERRGRLDAADLALTTSTRLTELCEEFGPDAGRLMGARTAHPTSS